MSIDGLMGAIYICACLSVPVMFGVVIGRASKPDVNVEDETLGRRIRLAVENIRFKHRFVTSDVQVIYTGDLVVKGDQSIYNLRIERRDLERLDA